MAKNKATIQVPIIGASRPRVCIAIGCQDTVKTKTHESIVGVLMVSAADITNSFVRMGGDIVSARGNAVQYAIDNNCTHVFFYDHDMKFPPDTLKRLLAHDKDIVTVEYNRRRLPAESVTTPMTERSETELYEARNIGGGCLLIKLSIFEKLEQPWFNFGRNSKWEVVIGEDTWFANTARDAGFKAWIDPTIKVSHLGDYEY